MFDRQSEEDFQEKKSRVGVVVLNLGVPLEFHASKVYTAAMYELFQHAIYLSGSFVLQEAWQSEQGMVYVVNHIYAERRQAWSRTQYHVLFDEGSGGYLCECGLYSHMGMLCCHAIRVLLSLGVREIPEVHIMKRWTKNACEALPKHLMIYKECNSALKDATYRHSSLYNKALEIVQMGNKNTEAYGAAMKVLLDAINILNETNQESDGRGLHDQGAAQVHDQDMPVPGARFCKAYIWEEDLDRYTNQFFQTAVDLANYHKNHHESCEEKLDEVMSLDSLGSMYQESDEEDMDVFDAYPTTEVCQEEAESDSEGCGKGNRKGGVCPINSRGSVKRFKKLNDLLSEEKRRLVEEMKLGGLMHIPKITRTNRYQQMWVLSKVDEKASAIIVDGRRDTPFDDKDAEKVLGVPGEGATINKNQAPHVLSSVRQTLGISSSETRISVIEEIVKKEYGRKMTKEESDAVKVAFVVCAVTYVLAPPLKHNYFMTDYWGGLHTPGLKHMYNSGKYIREEVLISAGRVKSELLGGKVKSNLSGCTFFMQVFYLDNLDLKDNNLPHDVIPRCKVYDQKTINRIIDANTSTGKKFRNPDIRTPQRPAHTVCYSRNMSSVRLIRNFTNYGDASSKSNRGPMVEEIASILVEKVGQYSSRCKAVLQLASKKGAKINKRHAHGWEGVLRETEIFVEEETSKIIAHIDEITNTVRHNNKRTREEENKGKDIPDDVFVPNTFISIKEVMSPLKIPEKSRHCHHVQPCVTQKNTFHEDLGNVSHKSDVNQMGCSTKRKRVEEASEEADPAIRNLDELIAAAEQHNPVNNDTEVHEQMPIQAQSADGRKWIYGPHSSLNTEVPSFDLGVENDEAVQVPSRELTILATTQQEEHTEQYTKQGGSGLEMVCTPAHHSILANRAAGTTPVSLNREIAAQELDIREEMEQATINLNVTHTQDGLSTQPHRKRTPKYVELTADHIRMSLSKGGVIENDLMTVAIRRYQQMDYVFALDKDEGCWRHWLEPEFVNHVSRGDVIVRYVQDMFIGEHINYDVHRCTEFILPVKFNFTWSTYIWDFPKKRIIVLDPTINNGNESDKVIQNRHRKVADNLHVALQTCIEEFFQGWAPDMARWNTVLPKGLNVGLCTGLDNRVYALHYGRNWMGSKFKRVLNPQNDGVVHSRMNILVDVLGLEGNIGHMPERYRNFLVRKKEKE
ncbi:hypothetical protein ZWY2020_016510 [Hordeum vulgare]|nr:hypothetical protein ZWY2020_016510 [Hordeum vulgare]